MDFTANQETLAQIGKLYLEQLALAARVQRLQAANATLAAEVKRLHQAAQPAGQAAEAEQE